MKLHVLGSYWKLPSFVELFLDSTWLKMSRMIHLKQKQFNAHAIGIAYQVTTPLAWCKKLKISSNVVLSSTLKAS